MIFILILWEKNNLNNREATWLRIIFMICIFKIKASKIGCN